MHPHRLPSHAVRGSEDAALEQARSGPRASDVHPRVPDDLMTAAVGLPGVGLSGQAARFAASLSAETCSERAAPGQPISHVPNVLQNMNLGTSSTGRTRALQHLWHVPPWPYDPDDPNWFRTPPWWESWREAAKLEAKGRLRVRERVQEMFDEIDALLDIRRPDPDSREFQVMARKANWLYKYRDSIADVFWDLGFRMAPTGSQATDFFQTMVGKNLDAFTECRFTQERLMDNVFRLAMAAINGRAEERLLAGVPASEVEALVSAEEAALDQARLKTYEFTAKARDR